MTRKIFKYTLEMTDVQNVEMNSSAEILSVQLERDSVALWAIVDPDQVTRTYKTFRIVGTGHDFNMDNYNYLGTFQKFNGGFIGHVFEEVTND